MNKETEIRISQALREIRRLLEVITIYSDPKSFYPVGRIDNLDKPVELEETLIKSMG